MNVFTDNKNFYPTPETLIAKMWDKIDKKRSIQNILEPSAGKGDIADYICKNYISQNKIDCIEFDDTLRDVLIGKTFRVVEKDFLKYNSRKHYDCIIMNPPFDKGSKHLLKAIQIAENNGGSQIVCLLNAETLFNLYSNDRKLLQRKLSKYDAEVEMLGEAFSDAERKTDVQVALVYINIPEPTYTSKLLEGIEKAEKRDFEERKVTDIVIDDGIEQAISHYKKEVEIVTSLAEEYLAITPYIQNSISSKYSSPVLKLQAGGYEIKNYGDINLAIEDLRIKYWSELFKNDKFTSMLNSDLQHKLSGMVNEMKDYDFSMDNIKLLQSRLICEMLDNLDDTIMSLFRELSQNYSYYSGSDNVHYYNGWKTNKAHKVNKKIILPINGFSAYSFKKDELDYWFITDKFNDIEKVLNYLNGQPYSFEGVGSIVERCCNLNITKNIDFKYFTCTFYKKGTCHITFKDETVLDALNIYAGKKNNWLPPSYGKVAYDNMSKEEQAVIDDFQGREEYEKVMNHPALYLLETKNMLSLPA